MISGGKQKAYKIEEGIFHCGTSVTMSFIGGKWKCIILWYLRNGELRFSEIKNLIPDITEKMLSLQLKSLKEDGFINRTVLGVKPPLHVQYSLTSLGESLIPVVEAITNWGINYAVKNGVVVDV